MIQEAQLSKNLKLVGLLERAGLKGRQLAEAFQFTYDSVLNVLKEQLKRGNFQEVLAILKGRPMAIGKKLVKDQITGHVVKGLMMRFGLRKIVAVGIAALLIPIIIAKIAHVLLKGNYVSDLVHSLQLKTKMQELFNSRNEIQPAPEPFLVAEEHTNEEEFLTD